MQSIRIDGTCPECGKAAPIVSHLSSKHIMCGEGFFITNCVPSGSETILEWTAFPMWESTVQWSTNLVSMPFTNLSDNLAYPLNSYTDTVHGAESECFYKVVLEP